MITPNQRSPEGISKIITLPGFAWAGSFQISAQIICRFSTCGTAGSFGANQGQVTAADQTGNPHSTRSGMVLTSGNYKIEAMEASGGKGVILKGTYNLSPG